MSKANIEKTIMEIFSDKEYLSDFLACKDQEELYKCCLSKGSGYTREEFDEFVEETMVKANKIANSLEDEEVQASHGISKKIRQAFTKALAAGLAVFSTAPMVQNFMPEVEAFETSETVENITEDAIYEDLDTSLSQEETIDEVLSDEEDMKDEILSEEDLNPDEETIDEVLSDEENMKSETSPEEDLNPNEEDTKDEVLSEEDLNPDEKDIKNEVSPEENLNPNEEDMKGEVLSEENLNPDEKDMKVEVLPEESLNPNLEDIKSETLPEENLTSDKNNTDIEKPTSQNNKKSNFKGKKANNQKSGFGYIGKTLGATLVIANAIQFWLGKKSRAERDEAISQKDTALLEIKAIKELSTYNPENGLINGKSLDSILNTDNNKFIAFLTTKVPVTLSIDKSDDLDPVAEEWKEDFLSFCKNLISTLDSIRRKFLFENIKINNKTFELLKEINSKVDCTLNRMSEFSSKQSSERRQLRQECFNNVEIGNLSSHDVMDKISKISDCLKKIVSTVSKIESNKEFYKLFDKKCRKKKT